MHDDSGPRFHSGSLELEHIVCDLCGCPDYEVRYRKPDNWLWLTLYEFPVVKCVRCGLVYVNPRPTADSLSLFYPSNFYENRDDANSQERYRREMARVPMPSTGRILDIGSARGDYPAAVKAKYPALEVHACDAYSGHSDHAEIIFHRGHVYDCGFPPDYFDLVTSWAVFEHLLAPSRYFAEVARILKPGAVFVLLVTNANSFYSTTARTEDIPRHTYHYSHDTLRRYAERFGMRVQALEYRDDIYDGRGFGTLVQIASAALRISWRDRALHAVPLWKKLLLKPVSLVDRALFTPHWEARMGRSGVIVATMQRRAD